MACSLGAGELGERLDEIAAIGAAALLGSETDGGRHLLRFRSDPDTRQRLERIVAAETRCCSFLELGLAEENGELVLRIAAPAAGQATADELARAFEV